MMNASNLSSELVRSPAADKCADENANERDLNCIAVQIGPIANEIKLSDKGGFKDVTLKNSLIWIRVRIALISACLIKRAAALVERERRSILCKDGIGRGKTGGKRIPARCQRHQRLVSRNLRDDGPHPIEAPLSV